MARPLRLEYEHACWHITSRGNEKRDIFRDDLDRLRFLVMLGETIIRFRWWIFAWVLMSNHYHLFIQTPEANLSRGMHWLNSRYVQYFNRRHGRCGHLFQGRFKGILVEKEAYFLTLARYIILNPVRAGIVDHPAAYRWSSYRQTAGLDRADPWLAVDGLLTAFGGPEEYIRFVAAATGNESPWDDLVEQVFLGRRAWIDEITARIAAAPRSEEHPRAQLRPGRPALTEVLAVVAATFDTTVEQLQAPKRSTSMARSIAAFLAFEDGLCRQGDIATALGTPGRGSISTMVRRCRDALAASIELRQLVATCRSKMKCAPPPSALLAAGRTAFYDPPRPFRPVARS